MLYNWLMKISACVWLTDSVRGCHYRWHVYLWSQWLGNGGWEVRRMEGSSCPLAGPASAQRYPPHPPLPRHTHTHPNIQELWKAMTSLKWMIIKCMLRSWEFCQRILLDSIVCHKSSYFFIKLTCWCWGFVTFFVIVHKYQVITYLGDVHQAGTDANVFVCVYGSLGSTGKRLLKHSLTSKDRFTQDQVRLCPGCSHDNKMIPWLLVFYSIR